MISAFVLVCFSILPQPPTAIHDYVDCVERNHFYDEEGRLIFEQFIFYRYLRGDGEFEVIGWRLLKDNSQLIIRDWKDGGYSALWKDGEIWRSVRARMYRETWLQHDPELCEREKLPKEKRKELSPIRVHK